MERPPWTATLHAPTVELQRPSLAARSERRCTVGAGAVRLRQRWTAAAKQRGRRDRARRRRRHGEVTTTMTHSCDIAPQLEAATASLSSSPSLVFSGSIVCVSLIWF
ncbi:choline-sulfatase [Sesbania bispinosa]|nr:choline-sulfatase [Sesbania bispinosa]